MLIIKCELECEVSYRVVFYPASLARTFNSTTPVGYIKIRITTAVLAFAATVTESVVFLVSVSFLCFRIVVRI